ncbi:hypothetical protein F4820DRAFT_468016 [Hypoxylon rubiginosum]|uniref:Uncharacterized protein n=1 Tax=Hypoxylon rubiginosum TaxID=110542 RepID=A0ACB9YGT1_9PEZI|nr:hypothetical protein F4820DRAFT_468016 [Hypoxylon rubiginosum]
MDNLCKGIPQRLHNGAVLVAMTAWHLYPDMSLFGAQSKNLQQRDSLISPGGHLTVGLEDSNPSSTAGVYWSLSLANLRFYENPVLATSNANDASRVSFQDLVLIRAEFIITLWKTLNLGTSDDSKLHEAEKALATDFISTSNTWLQLLEGGKRQRAQLPPDIRKDLEKDPEHPKYKRASEYFYKKHVCNVDPMPALVQATFKNLEDDPTAYSTMQGPSELIVTGNLKDWDGSEEAKNIKIDTLLVSGRNDNVSDLAIEPWFRSIPRVKWVTFERSSHMPHWEERERFMELVGTFLTKTLVRPRKQRATNRARALDRTYSRLIVNDEVVGAPLAIHPAPQQLQCAADELEQDGVPAQRGRAGDEFGVTVDEHFGHPGVQYGFSYFPRELFRTPSSWNKQSGDVVFERQHERGGHFAAWEQPEALANDHRDMFVKGGKAYDALKK